MYKLINSFILRSDTILSEQVIPLYDLDAVAGISSLLVGDEVPVDEIRIADIPRCDGAIHVIGDSMEPILHAGDIVLYKIVPNRRGGLFFGNIYLLAFDLDGEEYITIKYVHESATPGHYRLVSANPKHAPREVPISNVRAMAIVKACVRNFG